MKKFKLLRTWAKELHFLKYELIKNTLNAENWADFNRLPLVTQRYAIKEWFDMGMIYCLED